MTAYGMTDLGFVKKPATVIRAEIDASYKSTFGASIDTSDESLDGQFIGILAEREALLWDLAEECAHSHDADAVTGAPQEQLYALSGHLREPALHSETVATCCGDDGTVILQLSRASVEKTDVLFEATAEGTIAALDLWTDTTDYFVDDRVQNTDAGFTRCYVCITAGTSAGSGGPAGALEDITDGTVHWRWIGDGEGAVDIVFQSVETGPFVCLSPDLNVITTPISGWSTIRNLDDAIVGQAAETDEAFRLRREVEIAAPGEQTPDAIRETLLRRVDAVQSVTVFWNPQDDPDADGLPGHSVEALVRGGTDADVAFVLFKRCIGAGINSYGNTSEMVEDSEGIEHEIFFSRPAEKPIYIDIDITYDASVAPSDLAAQVKAAIKAWGDTFKTGKDVTASGVSAHAFDVNRNLGVECLLEVTDCDIDDAPAPGTSATVVIARRELATFALANIAVTLTPGTP